MADDILVIPVRRWLGCVGFVIVSVLLCLGVVLGNGQPGVRSLEGVAVSLAVLAGVAVLVVVIGWRTRVVLDAKGRTVLSRTTIFGVPVRRRLHALTSEDCVLVKCSTHQHSEHGSEPLRLVADRTHTWERRTVLVGPITVVNDRWDESQQSIAMAWQAARHLGLKVVQERSGVRTVLTPPSVAARGPAMQLPPPDGLEVEERDGGEVTIRWTRPMRREAWLVGGGAILVWAAASVLIATQGLDDIGIDAWVATSWRAIATGDGLLSLPTLALAPAGLVCAWLMTRGGLVHASPRGVVGARRSALGLAGQAIPAAHLQDIVAEGPTLVVRGDTQVATLSHGLSSEQAKWIAARVKGVPDPQAAGGPHVAGWKGRRLRFAAAVALAMTLSLAIASLEAVVTGLWLRRSEPVQQALRLAAAHPEVERMLGRPLAVGYVLHGGVAAFSSSPHADLTVPLAGPRGEATLAFGARKDSSAGWRVWHMRLWVGDQDTVLLDGHP